MTAQKELGVRCSKLLDAMLNDPDRPAWQLELARVTAECVSTCAILRIEHKKTQKSYAELLTKVESLESRYSELLYRLSTLKET